MSSEKMHFKKLIAVLVLIALSLIVGSLLLSFELRVMPEAPAGYTSLNNPMR